VLPLGDRLNDDEPPKEDEPPKQLPEKRNAD